MKSQKIVSLFVLTLFVLGFVVVAFPTNGNAQETPPGCCQYNNVNGDGQDSCFESVTGKGCPLPVMGRFVGFFENQECTDSGVCTVPERAVPTMSEWGMIVTAGVLGIIGFITIRRRKFAA